MGKPNAPGSAPALLHPPGQGVPRPSFSEEREFVMLMHWNTSLSSVVRSIPRIQSLDSGLTKNARTVHPPSRWEKRKSKSKAVPRAQAHVGRALLPAALHPKIELVIPSTNGRNLQ